MGADFTRKSICSRHGRVKLTGNNPLAACRQPQTAKGLLRAARLGNGEVAIPSRLTKGGKG